MSDQAGSLGGARPALVAGVRLGAYEILAPIGAGGMGEVYRARDTKLDREVAVKVLPAHLSSSPEAHARFEREAKAVAALSHPNILSIFDFGTQDCVAYAVMELLEGETLRASLQNGPIPRTQAVDYGVQIARGLSAAHERGVVHRDLKPENLFVSRDGHVKILDFGLAKRDAKTAPGEETSAPTVSGHTEPGTVMGTVGYMSPEQVRGQAVDHRSDIFSFGAVLYEMLFGKQAFKKQTAADTLSAILREEPAELEETGRSIPALLDHTVRHCLEKDRDKRFQSARDIVFALGETSGPALRVARPTPGRRRLWIAAAAIVAIAAVVGIVLARRQVRSATPGVKRIAVLPFENMGAPEDDYFVDGMSDEVRGKLTTLPEIEVMARNSSTPYKKTAKTPQMIAQELDVRYLLTGTVRWQKGEGGAGQVILRPELVEVVGSATPVSRWQQPFEAPLTDVFRVQSNIASQVARALGVALSSRDASRIDAAPTRNLAAYQEFLRGQQAETQTGIEGPRDSLAHYEEAVRLDPSFARAWAGIARAQGIRYLENSTPGLGEKARAAAEKAAELSPDGPAGQIALGHYNLNILGDSARASEHFKRALQLDPNDAEALLGLAATESNDGRLESSLAYVRKAKQVDPRSVGFSEVFPLVLLHRYPEAIAAADSALELSPSNFFIVEWEVMAYLAQGDLDGARAVLKKAQAHIEPKALAANVAQYNDLVWVLDDDERDYVLTLGPQAFGNRAYWAFALSLACALKKDEACFGKYAELAREDLVRQLRERPRDSQNKGMLGVSLGYLGRKEEAIREAELALGMAAATPAPDPHVNYYAAQTYAIVGEQDKAVQELEVLVKLPGFVTPNWLRIDPTFDTLRDNPRFQKLVAGK